MLRSTSTRLASRAFSSTASRRRFSSNPLDADSGALATHVHHSISLGLAALTPIYFLIPDTYSAGMFDKVFGVVLAANISAHSWIGLNYVATDYVPKVSKALLGPSRFAIAGMAGITFLGLSRMAISSDGGIKGCLKGLWNPPKKETK
jgi:hypothetical protein